MAMHDSRDAASIVTLRNLGPRSARLLAEAGVTSIGELKQIGVVRAYARVKSVQEKGVSLNLLWALVAGLQDRHWQSLTVQEKSLLLTELRRVGVFTKRSPHLKHAVEFATEDQGESRQIKKEHRGKKA